MILNVRFPCYPFELTAPISDLPRAFDRNLTIRRCDFALEGAPIGITTPTRISEVAALGDLSVDCVRKAPVLVGSFLCCGHLSKR
jgi:hypothetical protein